MSLAGAWVMTLLFGSRAHAFVASGLVSFGLFSISLGCQPAAHPADAHTEQTSPQGAIVVRCADTVEAMRRHMVSQNFDGHLERARALLIFPRIVKASLLFGGEGGNGVMVVRRPEGDWSNPAFYSLGAPSVGLQVGYEEAAVVLFVMDDATVTRLLERTLEVGSNTSVALEELGGKPAASQAEVFASAIVPMVLADGVFAGISLSGSVIAPRPKHNALYYGEHSGSSEILFGASRAPVEAELLRQVLGGRQRS